MQRDSAFDGLVVHTPRIIPFGERRLSSPSLSLLVLCAGLCGEGDDEFLVALGAFDGGGDGAVVDPAEGSLCEGTDFVDTALVDTRIADDSALADFGAFGLELGFDQQECPAAGFEQTGCGGKNLAQRNEGDVRRQDVGLLGDLFGGQVTGVGPFQADDAWIIPDLGMQLAVPDIHGVDAARAVLEYDIGESAGRCAQIKGNRALERGAERLDSGQEFEGAAADVREALDHAQVCLFRQELSGLAHDVVLPDAHFACEYEALGQRAAVAEALVNEKEIGRLLQRGLLPVLRGRRRRWYVPMIAALPRTCPVAAFRTSALVGDAGRSNTASKAYSLKK